MSDYWHAVHRAALGLPGSAEPRPRSMFETEPVPVAADDLETRDEDVDAAPSPAAAARAARAVEPPEPSTEDSRTLPTARPAPPAQAERVEPARVETRGERRAVPADAPARDDRAIPVPPVPITRDELERGEAGDRSMARSKVGRDGTEHSSDVGPLRALPLAAARADKPVAPESATVREIPAAIEPARTAVAPEPPPPPRAAPAEAVMIEPPPIVVAEPLRSVAGAPPEAASEPPLVIEIGRIDIRIASESAVAPPVAAATRDASAVLSLNDYLAQRSKAER